MLFESLLCHLVGDYWLQNDWMALNKKKNALIALTHSLVYTIPFLFITQSFWALFVICITHALIDGTDLVHRLNRIKNWNFNTDDGYDSERPIWLTVWLIILQDNTLHLLLNYLALRYLG